VPGLAVEHLCLALKLFLRLVLPDLPVTLTPACPQCMRLNPPPPGLRTHCIHFLPGLVDEAFLVTLVHLAEDFSSSTLYCVNNCSTIRLKLINIFMASSNNDQQKLFESYIRIINEDLGLGPKQKGTDIMNVTSIGSTGKPGTSHMDIAKSNLTPACENEETRQYAGSVDEIIDNIVSELDVIRTEKPAFKTTDVKLLLKDVRREVGRIVQLISKGDIQ